MTQSITKISLVSSGVTAPREEKFKPTLEIGTVQETAGSFKKFAIQGPRKSVVTPLISPAQHQSARRRLFGSLVRQVLNEKSHPFSRLDSEVKQDMINSITEELVQSHYKV